MVLLVNAWGKKRGGEKRVQGNILKKKKKKKRVAAESQKEKKDRSDYWDLLGGLHAHAVEPDTLGRAEMLADLQRTRLGGVEWAISGGLTTVEWAEKRS